MLRPYSRWTNMPSTKPAAEPGCGIFPKCGWFSAIYMTLYSRRQKSSTNTLVQNMSHMLWLCNAVGEYQGDDVSNFRIKLGVVRIRPRYSGRRVEMWLLRFSSDGQKMAPGPCSHEHSKQTNSVAFSPQVNYTDRATVTRQWNLVPTFVDRGMSRGQRGRSPTVVNLNFLDRSRYFSFK
jgi:hypothetical protein